LVTLSGFRHEWILALAAILQAFVGRIRALETLCLGIALLRLLPAENEHDSANKQRKCDQGYAMALVPYGLYEQERRPAKQRRATYDVSI
jgi:hypothetical protein